MTQPLRVGVDVGGTFTDVVAQAPSGALRMFKIPTTPDPSAAILAGIGRLLRPGEHLAALTHGSTVVTNALLEGRGARTALVTTRGFRDVLEIGRQQRDELYRLDVPGRAPPLVPRRLRFEIRERLDHTGRVLVPLDERDARRVAAALRRERPEALAVCLLHAYANPDHERRIARLLAEVVAHVCLSSDVNAEYREYERTHTTCANALLMPLVDRYLTDVEAGLAASGHQVPLRLMQSSGGMATTDAMRRVPLGMLMSGPAGGVAAAQALAAQVGIGDAVTLDMGGTSTDVCLIRDGRVETISERRVGGQPVRTRSLAVESIGAGGGSVVWIDDAGALRVGPQSAGATPGPACYGRGGDAATVTDACVLLGYVDPEASLGGLRLDPDLARRAVEPVAARLGLPADEAASGIVQVAQAAMVRAIRTVSVHRGHDVRRCALIAYGGGGPIHAGRLAQTLGMPRVVVPCLSSAFSAYGCLAADLRYDAVRTLRLRLADHPAGAWDDVFRQMERDLLAQLTREGVPPADAMLRRSMDLRYEGQNYELEVPVEPGDDGAAIGRKFGGIHRRLYEYATEEAVEAVNLRVAAVVATEVSPLSAGEAGGGTAHPRLRRAHHPGLGWLPTPVCARDRVPDEGHLEGPAIVEDPWSTVLIPPGARCHRDAHGHLWIEAAP